jgi:hypothetical protein
MSRAEFEAKLAELRDIGEGNFERDKDIDRSLERVVRATNALDRAVKRLQRRQGQRPTVEMVGPGIATTVTSGTTGPSSMSTTVSS